MAWVDAASDFTFDGKKATCNAEAKQSSNFNCMWKPASGGVNSGTHYWELKCNEGKQLWFGVTDEANFAAGWKLSGMMYGGNVSDGGGLKIPRFGPLVSAGDTVGCLVDFKDGGRLQVIYYHNGVCLGPAFDITNRQEWKPLFPVGSVGNGGITFEMNDSAPIPEARTRPAGAGNVGVFGHWASDEFSATMEITDASLSAHIVNNLGFNLTQVDGDNWKCSGPGRSTRMMGPPELMEKEQKFSKLIEDLATMTREGNSLKITSSSGESHVFAEKIPGAPVPVDKNVLKNV